MFVNCEVIWVIFYKFIDNLTSGQSLYRRWERLYENIVVVSIISEITSVLIRNRRILIDPIG